MANFRILILFIFFYNTSISQNRISTSISYSKLDIFHGFEFEKSINDKFNLHAGFEYGIVKSLFQSRFYPKVKVGGSYYLIDRKKIDLLAITQYSFSSFKFYRLTNDFVQYHEANLGVRWRYGNKWKIGQTVFIGGLWERSRNTLFNSKQSNIMLGYTFQIDCTYAF